MQQIYEKYMRRCIDIARNGKGRVAPNPMVGSVIVYNDEIIAEGYHQHYGGPHAEANAINSLANEEKLKGSTLYVNLEPCSHTGKTPPCSSLIVEKGIPKVVIGSVDPYTLVAGKGIERLRNAGVEVITGILNEDCEDLNKRFFTFHRKKRPFIILKWAQSADGYLDIERNPGTPIGPNWISNPISQIMVHKWRSVESGIMVGTNTVIYDNPSLTTRLWPGNSPTRITLDRNARIPKGSKLLNGEVPTLIYGAKGENRKNVSFFPDINKEVPLNEIMSDLFNKGIQSIIVEGGQELLQSFIDEGLWDEARVFKGSKNFNKGIVAPQLNATTKSFKQILDDSLVIYTK